MLTQLFVVVMVKGIFLRPLEVCGQNSLSQTDIVYKITESTPNITNLLSDLSIFTSNPINLLTGITDVVPKPEIQKLCVMITNQLIKYYGYIEDSFKVTTSDGYILTIFVCYSSKFTINQLKVIFLLHGMFDTSDTWCMNRGNQSLAYFLADQGFMVYLYNARGNRYSRNHETYNPNLPGKFWEFSFAEMAIYDVPAVIDEIIKRTNISKIACVGHSQGGTVLLIFASQKPEYHSKISSFTLLAPFTFMTHVGFPINDILRFFQLFTDTRNFEFAPNSLPQRLLAPYLCQLANGSYCNFAINFVLGPSENQRNNSMLGVYICHMPGGLSVNQLVHFGQWLVYNYMGPMKPTFTHPTPGDYPLDDIKIPIQLFYSRNDPHTNPIDIEILQSKLPNQMEIHEVLQFNHVDFLWSINANTLVYSKIVSFALGNM
ncbi:gastric triacylglycerol lipase-like [Contarinia nasturtii]|uniref:gastric triacylglycerol lipase-like n=1 Tax=Contarinia nasturtii TaxID=265458 RepID=UPI0012D3760C|nr:gastric triacylglycerol lipase-like [Contarinia nasturtii]